MLKYIQNSTSSVAEEGDFVGQIEVQSNDIGMGTDRRGIDSFLLKLIAIAGMTTDHIGIIFGRWLPLWAQSTLFAFGGLTFPIMAFMVCEGYRHTRDKKKYALRMLVFAIITQAPYMWVLLPQLNVMFTLLLGLLAIICAERIKTPVPRILAMLGFTAASLLCDWGGVGVPMILLYHFITAKRLRLIVPVLVPLCAMGIDSFLLVLAGNLEHGLPSLLYVAVGCVLTIPLLSCTAADAGAIP
jgi:hypothetical protein